jgi:sterol desaturase/sphingolipid hydroxylase (fatty acid hydroxylase superfamily)
MNSGSLCSRNFTSKPERLPDRLRSLLMKTALVIVGLLALLGVTVGWAIWGWQQTAGTAMGFHGWLAMILGIVFTIVVGCGLMGLMFYSSRYGYDERASDLSDKNKS